MKIKKNLIQRSENRNRSTNVKGHSKLDKHEDYISPNYGLIFYYNFL